MSNNLLNSAQSKIYQQIDWPEITSFFCNFIHFDENKQSAQEYHFFNNETSIHSVYDQMDKIDSLLEEHRDELGLFARISCENQVRLDIDYLLKGSSLNLEKINQIILCIEYYLSTKRLINFQFTPENEDRLKSRLQKHLIKEFRSFIQPNGKIDYLKHPKLKFIHTELLEFDSNIKKQLISIIASKQYKNALQIPGYDIVNDHYVIAIRSDSYNTKMGQIIYRSETGHTLYIEPFPIRTLVERRLEKIMELENEKLKLARKFAISIGEEIPQVDIIYNDIINFDSILARIKLKNAWNLSRPEISSDRDIILYDYAHPLIDNCITNNIHIEDSSQGFIISGPNTGGKTVVLKSLLCIQLMYQKALFVPAKKASLHCYEAIFYHGSDHQDITQGLSSFSAEVSQFQKTYSNLKNKSLIFCDEIFNSTSSAEASALAYSLVKAVVSDYPNTKTILSTHHEELKEYFFKDKKFQSAHMGFDSKSKTPTYKIIEGTPGNSFAFDIFKQHFSHQSREAILKGANALLEDEHKDFSILNKRLLNEEATLLDYEKKLNSRDESIQTREKQIEGLLELKESQLKEKYHTLENFYKEKANKAIDAIKRENKTNRNKALSDLDMIKEQPSLKPNLVKPEKFEVGLYYFSSLLNKDVLLKEIRNNKATVFAGKIKSKVNTSTLYKSNFKKEVEDFSFHYNKNECSPISIDCRGKRLEEFESIIEKALSDLKSDSLPYLEVIHGHGTGALKNWLRKFLRNNNDYIIAEDQSGNDGHTIIKLKD